MSLLFIIFKNPFPTSLHFTKPALARRQCFFISYKMLKYKNRNYFLYNAHGKTTSRDPLDFMPELQGDLEIIGKKAESASASKNGEIVESRSQDLANEQARIAQTIGFI